jgi:hypothetical protein
MVLLDSHGDAHANDGFCTAIRKASVIGEIKQSFSSFTIQITPEEKKIEKISFADSSK